MWISRDAFMQLRERVNALESEVTTLSHKLNNKTEFTIFPDYGLFAREDIDHNTLFKKLLEHLGLVVCVKKQEPKAVEFKKRGK